MISLVPHRVPALLLLIASGLGACVAPTEKAAPGSHLAEAEGAPVHYLDSGGSDEEGLVLIHGWAGSTAAWKDQFPAWSELGRTLVIDLPGHGASEPPPNGYSFASFADAVVAVMDDAGLRRGVLVGHSNGAPVVLQVHHRHPERVAGLVSIDGALKGLFSREQAEPLFAPFRGPQWQTAMRGLVEGMAAAMDADDRDAVVDMALATRQEAVIGGMDAIFGPDAWHEGPIDVPLLLVLAEQPTWSPDYEAWVRTIAPHVDYRVWSGVTHYLQMERPEALRDAMADFLAANALLGSSAER